jgi:predicted DNA-binding protein
MSRDFGAEPPPWLQTPDEGQGEESPVVADEQEPDWLKKKKEKQMTFILTQDIKARMEALADRLGASKSEVARALLETALGMVDGGEIVFEMIQTATTHLAAHRRQIK